MAADDYLNNPADQGVPDLDTSSPMAGNRPASGARRATPGEVLSSGFQGAQNAGDFLGLDTEFTASQDPNQVFGAQSPLDLVQPPSTYIDDGSQPGYAPVAPEPAPMPDGDAAQEFAQAPSAFEFGEDLGSEEGEVAQGEEGAPAKRSRLVAALVVVALVAGGALYGPQLYSTYFGHATEEVAVTPTPRLPENPAKSDAPATPGKSAPDVSATGKEPAPATSTGSAPTAAKEPRKPSTSPRSSTGATPSTSGARGPEPVASSDQGQTDVTSLPAVPSASSAAPQTSSEFPDLQSAEFAWASEDKLDLIWRGDHVPLEAVQAPAKTLMPRVGNVRVFTTEGDVFDGRLYAVGQNRVWVDAAPGRIGLDGDRVEKIEVLAPIPAGVALGSQEKEPVNSKRVRVRVPGGMLYGRVLKSEGDEVIMVLDDGGKVHVKASDIEELGPGRAVVVRR